MQKGLAGQEASGARRTLPMQLAGKGVGAGSGQMMETDNRPSRRVALKNKAMIEASVYSPYAYPQQALFVLTPTGAVREQRVTYLISIWILDNGQSL